MGFPEDLADWLALHRRQQATERLAASSWADDRLVFATTTGTVIEPRNARRHLAEVCERSGVPIVRPNELRHSCASLLSDAGVPLELIADLLGHTTTDMLDRTYRHRLRPVVDVAAGDLGRRSSDDACCNLGHPARLAVPAGSLPMLRRRPLGETSARCRTLATPERCSCASRTHRPAPQRGNVRRHEPDAPALYIDVIGREVDRIRRAGACG
ncbi:MAG: tyrosine-type recombinase/integrase [Ilumatobacteraceae bacterium]